MTNTDSVQYWPFPFIWPKNIQGVTFWPLGFIKKKNFIQIAYLKKVKREFWTTQIEETIFIIKKKQIKLLNY